MDTTQEQVGLDRRRFLAGAAVAAGAWAAPTVLTLDRANAAIVGTAMCVDSAHVLKLVLSGTVNQTIGPISECVQSGDKNVATLSLPPGSLTPLVTATVGATSCNGTTGCSSASSLANLVVNLTSIAPVSLSAEAVTADASCSGGSTTRDASLVQGKLVLGAVSQDLPVNPGPNTVVIDTLSDTGPLGVRLVLNEQTGPSSVQAIHLIVQVRVGTTVTQTVDLVVGFASASC